VLLLCCTGTLPVGVHATKATFASQNCDFVGYPAVTRNVSLPFAWQAVQISSMYPYLTGNTAFILANDASPSPYLELSAQSLDSSNQNDDLLGACFAYFNPTSTVPTGGIFHQLVGPITVASCPMASCAPGTSGGPGGFFAIWNIQSTVAQAGFTLSYTMDAQPFWQTGDGKPSDASVAEAKKHHKHQRLHQRLNKHN